jgi:hypothetical protein
VKAVSAKARARPEEAVEVLERLDPKIDGSRLPGTRAIIRIVSS